jgi:hypothetical protein
MMVSISYKINFQFVVSIELLLSCAFTSRYFSCILIDGAEGDACCLIGLFIDVPTHTHSSNFILYERGVPRYSTTLCMHDTDKWKKATLSTTIPVAQSF